MKMNYELILVNGKMIKEMGLDKRYIKQERKNIQDNS